MSTAVATVQQVGRDASALEVLERVIVAGDLAALKPEERVALYARTCESLGLNPLTRPFEYINLNNKLTLYVRKDATDQLRRLYRVSIDNLRSERDAELGLLTVTADGHTPDGRRDQSTGAVYVKGLSGEALANAVMKAETKAKRRLTLSLVGLGFLDEIEVEGADRVDVDPETGEVHEAPKAKRSLLDTVQAQQQRMSASPAAAAPASPLGDAAAASATSPAATDGVTTPVAAQPDGSGGGNGEPPAAAPAATGTCDDEDASPMGLGHCAKPTGHAGPHASKDGTWPR